MRICCDFLIAFLLIPLTIYAETPDSVPKDLDHYLALPDDSFSWEVVERVEKNGENSLLIDMTSQTWHGIPWKHYLYLALPNRMVHSDHAVLYIGGGRNGRKPGDGDRTLVRTLAESSGMPVGMLMQVPNQPLLGNYYEDALIGETLLKAIETKDTTWPLLFPMAKSAIRGLDAIQQSLKKEKGLDVKSMIVAGASKRGWTTWLTGASKDSRVKAIVPIVIDTLNMAKQMEYQLETWGEYSPSIHDYTERNLVQMFEKPLGEFEQSLWRMIDPYSYRSRYTMPKLLIHGTNDPYWTVDATRHYWNDLSGPKYILTLPNAGHGLDGQQHKAAQTISVFARYAAQDLPWPKSEWKLDEQLMNYVVTIDSEIPAKRYKLWTAASETKDFRKMKWTSKTVRSNSTGKVVIEVPKPASGHVAFYVEIEAAEYGIPFSVTTQVWRF